MGAKRNIALWVGAFLLVVLVFYGLDHAIMSAQGLPLTLDLRPAQ